MPFLRGILFTVVGWVLGFVIAMVLYMPSCIVASAVTGSEYRGEHLANRLNVVPWLGAVVGLGAAVWLGILEAQNRKAKERARRQALESEELACQQRHTAEQQAYRRELIDLGEQAIRLFEALPVALAEAEHNLDAAETDFAEGVFAPFWDSIERAATNLCRFAEAVHGLGAASFRYEALAKAYEASPPKFPLAQDSLTKLAVSAATSKRMQDMVRKAQRSFEFATIYEQRKTNQILIAGFTNLAQALRDMSARLETSLDELARSIDGMSSSVKRSMDGVEARLSDIGEDQSKRATDSALRERKALEMLDNIQRRRRPSFWEGPHP